MAQTSIDIDPDTLEMTIGPWRMPLSKVARLWSVVGIFPGIPDERAQRWVIQTSSEIMMAPALRLPTPSHVEAWANWGREHHSLYQFELAGWPWSVSTWRWAWCAMRKKSGRFDLNVWHAVQAHALNQDLGNTPWPFTLN